MEKILFFHHSSAIGGAGISGLNAIRTLRKLGYDVVVYCRGEQSDMVELFRSNGFKTIDGKNSPTFIPHCVGSSYSFFSPAFWSYIVSVFKEKKQIAQYIKKENPDIVVVNSMTLFWIGKIAKSFSKKTVCFFRETYVHGLIGFRTRFIRKKLSKYFDKVLFISKYEADLTLEVSEEKKVVLYNMIEPSSYDEVDVASIKKSFNIGTDEKLLLYVGGMSKLKGAYEALQIINKLPANIKLLFVGYSPKNKLKKISDCKGVKAKIKYVLKHDFEAKCLNFIYAHNLYDRIKFISTQKNIAPLFKIADYVLIPFTQPHQARPVFEAGYAKKPVIITDYPNIRDVINSESGYLFKKGDYNSIYQIISEISEYPEQVQARISENYKNTINRHSSEVYSREISLIFSSL